MKDHKYNILYLDDEESNLRIFRAAFKQFYKIFIAKSGMEGLEVLKENEIHLIITDQRMPKMTGVEFLERILHDYPEPVRIILTGFSDIEDIIRALNKCAIYRYIVKPWNREEMKLTIDKALETYQLRKDNLSLVNELKQINANLEDKIKERTAELLEAKEKAEEASRAKELFLSTMSHEIRTPLNAIVGVSNLLKMADIPQEHLDSIEILEISANNLLVLINDILDLSKIEAGKIELESTDFNLKNLIRGIHKTLDTKVSDKGLDLELDFDDQLPDFIVGDQVRLGQIITNLLSNAVKFTEYGFVRTTVKKIKERDDEVDLLFIIQDSGIGISEEMINKIFEDFSQASTDTTRKYGGTGLGLGITKKLVGLHGGEIIVESEVGKGSAFKFQINFRKSDKVIEDERLTIKSQDELKDLEGLNILVVEDNKFNQAIAKKFLTGWNAEVTFANNGVEALEILKTDRSFKIILMDIQMPEMDGYEATKQIRSLPQPYYQEIPIIALTASTLSGEREKVLKAGMNDFVMKPFKPEMLYGTIQTFSSGKIAGGNKEEKEEEKEAQRGEIKFGRFKRMVENDASFYAELLELTIEDYKQFKEEFDESIDKSEHEKISEICHKIRPSLITLGLKWLDDDILALRGKLKEEPPNSEKIQAEKEKIIYNLDFVMESLQKELDQV
ncbi:response regulator [Flexithrix dorotheae]|uniref:response regulator n=1 Tax=Flexithrix dorotheae TaxID=70993 RepID=UPI0003632B99|nr:response regulator [Flexithrix dorotheae]